MSIVSVQHTHRFWATVFAIGVVFAVAVMTPNFLQRIDDRYPYAGIAIMGPDAEIHYAARVREVFDGFLATGNTFYSDIKNVPFLQPPLPEAVIAFAAKLSHIDPVTMFLVLKAVYSIILVLVLTWALVAITRRTWESLLAVITLLFAGSILGGPWILPQYFSSENQLEFLRFSRAINPQWTFVWFALWLGCIASWISTHRRLHLVAAALSVVVLVYSYVYAWTFAFACMGFVTLWYIIHRNWKHFRELALFWVIVGVLSSWYGLHLVQTMHHPWYAESALRLGLLHSRMPIAGMWLTVLVVGGFIAKRVWPWTGPLLPALGLGGLLAINQHLITGSFIVPHHYHWYFVQPLGSLLAVLLMLMWMRTLRPPTTIKSMGFVLIALTCVCLGFAQQHRAYESVAAEWGNAQKLAPVIHYFDGMPAGTVIGSSDYQLLDLVPIYSSADVYTSTNANNYLVPLTRARDVYFFSLWLAGITPKQAAIDFASTRRFTLSSRIYAIYYRELSGAYDRIPNDLVAEHAKAYEAYYRLSLKEKLTRYSFSYLVTTPSDASTTQLKSVLAAAKVVFSANGYTVYRL